jgi:hypothetical protein
MDFADVESIREFNRIADEVELPREYVVCPHCGLHSWRLPPHGKEPCPLVQQMAEQLGLRFDAERMQAIRAGVHMEESTKALHRFFDRYGEGDSE